MNTWFGNISVNLKLGLGFGLVLVLTSILALTGWTSLGSLIDFADSLLFLMAIPNLVGVYLLMPVVKRDLANYLARLRSGEIKPAAQRAG